MAREMLYEKEFKGNNICCLADCNAVLFVRLRLVGIYFCQKQ